MFIKEFLVKNNFGRKKSFWLKKKFCQKIFGQKNVGKKVFGQTKIWVKKC